MKIYDSVFENNIGERAVYSDALYTRISNTTFKDGSTGAAYFDGERIFIDNCNFIGNKSVVGGAIYSSGYLTISNSSFSGNEAVGNFSNSGSGGALHAAGHTDIIDSTFSDNIAAHQGGGIYSTSRLVLERVKMTANIVSSGNGGAIFQDHGVLSVIESVLTENSTSNVGGAVYIVEASWKDTGNHTIEYSQLSANKAYHGGAIYTIAHVTLQDITVSGNIATDGGGGLANEGNPDDVVKVINSTFSHNQASRGANIINYNGRGNGKIRLSNTLIANPQQSTNCLGSEIISTGYNLDSDNSCSLTATGDLAGVNAEIGELSDNGSTTKTHALNSTSPAIDVGDPNVCINNPNLDQRYYYRNDDRCDIGAYEFGSARAQSGILAFKLAETQAKEEVGTAMVVVSRREGSEGPVSVNIYTTIFSTASGRYNTYSNADFQHIEPTLEWADGDNADKTVEIPIFDDSSKEGTKYFWLKLRHANGGASLGEQVDHKVIILDDEAKPGTLALTEASISVDEQVGKATVTILRSQGDFGTVSVDYLTQDDSAINGDDYTAVSGTLTFLNGETSKSIEIDIIDDSSTETTESFSLVLSNPIGGAVLGIASAIDISITDNDTTEGGTNNTTIGNFSFNNTNTTVVESDGSVGIEVMRSGAGIGEASVEYATRDGSAASGSDYSQNSGTLTFAVGQTRQTITIDITDDILLEENENFSIILSNSTGALLSDGAKITVNIIDNDGGAGRFKVNMDQVEVKESDGEVSIQLTREEGSSGDVSIDYSTVAESAGENSDFIPVSGTLHFVGGEKVKTMSVNIIDDNLEEGQESFWVKFTNPIGGATLSSNDSIKVIITKNDLPIDNTAGPAAVTNGEKSDGGGGATHPLVFILMSIFIVFLRNRRLKEVKQ